ncbi:MAG: PPC domain-containing DNA-binding protein [Candidatus Neomarinimicrobiota bacterium]|tara:strand:+ start:965 stop:1384 length:420 start_codon:yes stop_codon:yes gene_type:complete
MKYKKVDDKIYVSIDKGELVNDKLLEVAKIEKLNSGWINGLGAISDIEIGYWDIEKKIYIKKYFDEDYELLSLIGNISLVNNESFIHTHISFSNTEFKVFGGHMFDAKVIAAAEFCIFSSNYHLHRKLNCDIGLSLWDI